MARLHSTLTVVLMLAAPAALPLALAGCDGGLIVGGLALAAGGGYAASQERGVDGAASDFAIKNDIAKAFIETDPRLQLGITTSVYNGRVLLTGQVPTEAMKIAAAQIAGRTHDVRTVYNEVEVMPIEGVWNNAQDAWITTQVRSQLVLDRDIRSVNYTVDTENGSVYLIGSARSQPELDRAVDLARHVQGVKRVVSYVELRGGSPVAAMPTPAARPMGPSPAMGPGGSGAGPQAPIEVQKL